MKYYEILLTVIETIINLLMSIFLNAICVFREEFRFNEEIDEVVIIANGPSLKQEKKEYNRYANKNNVFVVNAFCLNKEFTILKPRFYVIMDDAFFRTRVDKRLSDLREGVLSGIVQQTDWRMHVILPMKAKRSDFAQRLKANDYVVVCFVKNIPFIGGYFRINNFLARLGASNPFYQNVLVACIFLSFNLNPSKIRIFGADHSWHRDLYLEGNRLMSKDRHFSKSSSDIKLVNLSSKGKDIHLHNELFNLSRLFGIYHFLHRFALGKNISIINHTKSSWIDAFKRE